MKNKGYTILNKNVYVHHYEIDIIAMDNDVMVFVEVRKRSSLDLAFDHKKLSRLYHGVELYCQYQYIDKLRRIDFIVFGENNTYEHFENIYLDL